MTNRDQPDEPGTRIEILRANTADELEALTNAQIARGWRSPLYHVQVAPDGKWWFITLFYNRSAEFPRTSATLEFLESLAPEQRVALRKILKPEQIDRLNSVAHARGTRLAIVAPELLENDRE